MTPLVGGTPSGRGGPFRHGRQPGEPGIGDSPAQAGLVTGPPAPSVVWPDNEPAGLSPIFGDPPTGLPAGTLIDGSQAFFDYSGSGGDDLGATFNFGAKWDGGPRILSTTSAGSKYPNVIRKNLLIGDPSGFNGLANDDEFVNDYEKIYIRTVFKYSANWEFNTQNEKLFYWGQADGIGSAFYVGISTSTHRLAIINQAVNGGDVGEGRSATTMTVDEWHTFELIVTAQSAVGVADGSFEVIYDDVALTDFAGPWSSQSAVEWFNSSNSTRLFSGMQLYVFWGGQGPPKTVNDHIDIGEFYITGLVA